MSNLLGLAFYVIDECRVATHLGSPVAASGTHKNTKKAIILLYQFILLIFENILFIDMDKTEKARNHGCCYKGA